MSSEGPPKSKAGAGEEKGNLGIEAETGLMRPQPKESWKLLKAERGKEQILSWSLQEEALSVL